MESLDHQQTTWLQLTQTGANHNWTNWLATLQSAAKMPCHTGPRTLPSQSWASFATWTLCVRLLVHRRTKSHCLFLRCEAKERRWVKSGWDTYLLDLSSQSGSSLVDQDESFTINAQKPASIPMCFPRDGKLQRKLALVEHCNPSPWMLFDVLYLGWTPVRKEKHFLSSPKDIVWLTSGEWW